MCRRIFISCHLLLMLAMLVVFSGASALQAAAAEPISVSENDWPWWRGTGRDGVAAAGQNPPLSWSETENVRWSAPIPGRGHSSPTVVGDQVFLTTADEEQQIQWVLCFDRHDGSLQWKTPVHQGGLPEEMNEKASHASSTVACDGHSIFVNFLNDGAVHTTALNLRGEVIWQTRVNDYEIHQGYGSSPTPYQSLVLVSADNKGGGAVAGLDRSTGEIVWKQERPELPNYSSPIVVHADGRDQLVLTGCDLVSSFNPLTGEKLWEADAATTECVTSTVTNGELVYSSGGYPENHVTAIKADGSGEIVWEHRVRLYVPSMLIRDQYLYTVADGGVATCYEASTGKEVWQARLGGSFTASPVMVDDKIYATNEEGGTIIFKATPEKFEKLAENELGESVFATPVICRDQIFMRVATRNEGERQEMLYCIGKP